MSRCFRLVCVRASELSVPLAEPFVIATGRVDSTPNVLVEAELIDLASGARATGLGEAATFFPLTKETPAAVLGAFAAMPAGSEFGELTELSRVTLELASGFPAVRAGLESALLDALTKLLGVPLRRFLAQDAVDSLATDVTLSLGDPGRLAKVARRWWARGFRVFKVKVGRDLDQAARTLEEVSQAVPDARYRIDANGALTAAEALALASETDALGLSVECWEQPCGRLALDQMAEVAAALEAPVVADESVATLDDLGRVVRAKAADAINLKLVKSGGPLACLELGREARKRGLGLMFGAMVETRLGLSAAANVAASLGGVDFADLDTDFLMSVHSFRGGYTAQGPRMDLSDAAGLGIERMS